MIPQPASVTVERDEPPRAPRGQAGYRDAAGTPGHARRELRIQRRREWLPHVVLLPFSVVWNGMLLGMYADVLTQDPSAFPVLICSLPHATVGVALLVASVRGLLRRVRITVAGSLLVVRQWPRPMGEQCRIEVGFLRELFVEVREGRRFPVRIPTTYAICAVVAGGAVELATGFASADEARYVAHVIEEHLGIGGDPSANEAA